MRAGTTAADALSGVAVAAGRLRPGRTNGDGLGDACVRFLLQSSTKKMVSAGKGSGRSSKGYFKPGNGPGGAGSAGAGGPGHAIQPAAVQDHRGGLHREVSAYLRAWANAANVAVGTAVSSGVLSGDVLQALCDARLATFKSPVKPATGAASAAPPSLAWTISLFQPCDVAEFEAGTDCTLATAKAISKCGKKLLRTDNALPVGAEREAAEAALRERVTLAVEASLRPWLAR